MQEGLVVGYRGVRELLGIGMRDVAALIKFDKARGSQVFKRADKQKRPVVRALASDIWPLYEAWVAQPKKSRQ